VPDVRRRRIEGEVITGPQIRQARRLLDWRISGLAKKAGLPISTIERAECAEGEAPITLAHEAAIRLALESAGVEFTSGDVPGVRVKAKGKSAK
jgi:hypothetical protein